MAWKQKENAPRPIRHVRYRPASESEANAQQRAIHRLLAELVRQERASEENSDASQRR